MLMRHVHPKLQFTHILPYGAILHENGVQFVVFSRSATGMRLLIYDRVEDLDPEEIIEFSPQNDRWGDIWSIFVPGLSAGALYHFQADGPHDPETGQWFDGTAQLIDPYAKALAGNFLPSPDGIVRPPKCVVVDDYFDWEGDRHIRHSVSESIIYETHVKGFTADKSSGVQQPGTYLGIIEKIPYLKSLGVTAVELLPVHYHVDEQFLAQRGKTNYWGYNTLGFFAPDPRYAASGPDGAVPEFQAMVRALHSLSLIHI